MKKLIGVAIIMLTLILSVIYRQLSHRAPKVQAQKAYVPASLRDGVVLSCLLLQ